MPRATVKKPLVKPTAAEQKATAEAKARRADPRLFPQMLYKPGAELETLTVKDPVDLKEALKQGWKETP